MLDDFSLFQYLREDELYCHVCTELTQFLSLVGKKLSCNWLDSLIFWLGGYENIQEPGRVEVRWMNVAACGRKLMPSMPSDH